MRRWPLVALALAAVAAACGTFGSEGAAPTDAGGDGGVPDGEGVDVFDAGDAPFDTAPLAFCSAHPDAAICDDFDELAVIDPRWTVVADGGDASVSDFAFSPPRSLLLTSLVPPVGGRCVHDQVFLRQGLAITTSSFRVGASYYVDYDPAHGANGGFDIRIDSNASNHCNLYLHWTGGQPSIFADEVIATVPTSAAETLFLTSSPLPKAWVRMDVDFHVSDGGTNVSVALDNAAAVDAGTLVGCRGTSLVQMQLVSNCIDPSAPRPFAIYIDDVLLELE